jgi:hypothetical protein
MRPELRDRILAAADEASRKLGADTFEQGVEMAYRLSASVTELLDKIRTREQFAAVLDGMPDLPVGKEGLAAAAFRMIPEFISTQMREHASTWLKELPGTPTGRRRALRSTEQAAVCRYMGTLLGEGVDCKTCKKRAAQRFGVGVRTIERAWARRAVLATEFAEPDFAEVMDYLKQLAFSEKDSTD